MPYFVCFTYMYLRRKNLESCVFCMFRIFEDIGAHICEAANVCPPVQKCHHSYFGRVVRRVLQQSTCSNTRQCNRRRQFLATLDKQPTVCFDTTGQRKVDFMELPDSCPAVLLNPSLCHLFQGALHILSLSITLANGKVHLKFCPNLFSFSRLPLKRLNFFVATDKGFPTPPGNTGPQFKVQKIPKCN